MVWLWLSFSLVLQPRIVKTGKTVHKYMGRLSHLVILCRFEWKLGCRPVRTSIYNDRGANIRSWLFKSSNFYPLSVCLRLWMTKISRWNQQICCKKFYFICVILESYTHLSVMARFKGSVFRTRLGLEKNVFVQESGSESGIASFFLKAAKSCLKWRYKSPVTACKKRYCREMKLEKRTATAWTDHEHVAL